MASWLAALVDSIVKLGIDEVHTVFILHVPATCAMQRVPERVQFVGVAQADVGRG